MKRTILLPAFAAFLLPLSSFADKETVNGILWTYTVSDGKAQIGEGTASSPAIHSGTRGNVVVPSTLGGFPVTSIGAYAFSGCYVFSSMTIPAGVTSIGDYAFEGCDSMTSVSIPDGVTSMGAHVFDGCIRLAEVSLPDGVDRIEECSFYNCSSLRTISIPMSVTSIGGTAFTGCTNLSKVAISDLRKWCEIEFSSNPLDWGNPVLSIDGVDTVDLRIPEGVTQVGARAFMGWSRLETIVIPDSVTNVAAAAFAGCPGLTSAAIGDGVVAIGPNAFTGCSGLTSLVIPFEVTEIGTDAFRFCSGLESLWLPWRFYWKETSSLSIPSGTEVHYYDYPLDVESACGVAAPAGRTLWRADRSVTATVSEPDPEGGRRQHCFGWSGTGSVPRSGTGTNVTFTISEKSSLEWLWRPEVRIDCSFSGSVTATPVAGWFEQDGAPVVVPIPVDSPSFLLSLGGDKDGVDVDMDARTLTIPADAPRAVSVEIKAVAVDGSFDLFVDAESGDDANTGWQWATAKKTIQAAIDAAPDGGTIHVGPGVYADIFNSGSKALRIESAAGPERTFIDGQGRRRCAKLSNQETARDPCATLAGFTLRNGCKGDGGAAGAYLGRLESCVITNCAAANEAAAAANCELTSCLVAGNVASNLNATTRGFVCNNAVLRNCTVVGNRTVEGNGAPLFRGSVLRDCIVWDNDRFGTTAFSSDTAVDHTASEEDAAGEGNILLTASPFAGEGVWCLARESPCIDAGAGTFGPDATDLAGVARVQGRRVDLGCYEFPFELFVDAESGDDANDGTRWSTALKTIQAAIDDAPDGGTIHVGPGVYADIFNSGSKALRIESAAGPERTFIDGRGRRRCAKLSNQETARDPCATLAGFTLRNGCRNDAGVGGVSLGRLENCVISNCATAYEAAAAANCELTSCLVVGNVASNLNATTRGFVCNNAVLRNCTVVGNRTVEGNGAPLFRGCVLRDCIVWDNDRFGTTAFSSDTAVDHTASEEDAPGEGNVLLAVSPFVGEGVWSLAAGSPCIDAGAGTFGPDATDLAGVARVQGRRVDLGCYEFPFELFVDAESGDDANDGTRWSTALKTIQAAIDVAPDGGTIHVGPGVYGTIVNSGSKALRIESEAGPARTFIDGQGRRRCAKLSNQETARDPCATLAGFTLRNGCRNDAGVGGVYLGRLENSVVSNCVSAYEAGAAANCELLNCLVVGNVASNLNASDRGYVCYGATLRNCTVVGNRTAKGNRGPLFRNSILRDCIVWDNDRFGTTAFSSDTAVDHTASEEDSPGEGNVLLAVSPFAGEGVWSLAAESPCIDAGAGTFEADETDLAGEPRVQGRRVDLGCFESPFAGPGSTTYTTPVPVPYSWLDGFVLGDGTAEGYEDAAWAPACNGVHEVWACYVAGLDPTNAAERFEARIGFENGDPVVTWTPDLNEGGTKSERVYTVEGKTNLVDKSWGPTNESTRFFRVKVRMP